MPQRDLDKPFLMPIEDVFSIKGRGTVATGRIEQGVIKINDPVEIVGLKPTQTSVVTGVEAFKKTSTKVRQVTTLVCCCAVSSALQIERGRVIVAPGTLTPHRV